MEEVYVNVDELKQPVNRTEGETQVIRRSLKGSNKQNSSKRSNKWRYRYGFVCLGLLSVFLLIGIGFTINHVVNLTGIRQNLTELVEINNLQISSLTEERNQLKANLTKMSEYIARLQNECPTGWDRLNDSCYFVSVRTGSWDEGRQDCKERGADLVVIENSEEMNFLVKNKGSWIGLNDREEEGSWKWVNGAPLTFVFWDDNQPDNWNGNSNCPEEDCVHISQALKWNDYSCITPQRWICEKKMVHP